MERRGLARAGGRSASAPAAIATALALTSCSLVLQYTDGTGERSETECHDGMDNDLDGLIDCDDDSCARCVALPTNECPLGWAPRTIAEVGDHPVVTCDPGGGLAFRECPPEPPSDAVIVEPGVGRLATMLEAHPDATELWLAPGEHVEDVSIVPGPSGGEIVVRGFCGPDRSLPLLVPSAGRSWPIRAVRGALVLRDVDIVVDTDGSPPVDSPESRLTLDRARVVATPVVGERRWRSTTGALGIERSVFELEIDLGPGQLLTVRDSYVVGVIAQSATVQIERAIMGNAFGGRAAQLTVSDFGALLTARDVFASCMDVYALSGAELSLERAVIEDAQLVTRTYVRGRAVTLTDVSVVDTGRTCLPATGLAVTNAELVANRVLVVGEANYGARFSVASGTVRDLAVVGASSVGVQSSCSGIDLDRVRVSSAGDVGLRIAACGTDAMPTTIHRAYVDTIPAAPCESNCSPPRAGIAIHGGPWSLTDAWIEDVDGCGLFLANGTPTDAAVRGTIRSSRIGACLPGRSAGLGPDVTFEGNEQDLSFDPELCVAGDCPAP